MTPPGDEIPDFSWLKERDEQQSEPESAAQTESSPTASKSEEQAEPQSDDLTLATNESQEAEEETASDPSDPAAETWIEPPPELYRNPGVLPPLPEAPILKSQTDPGQPAETRATAEESVFSDTDEDVPESGNDSQVATHIMPERQQSPVSTSEQFSSHLHPDDDQTVEIDVSQVPTHDLGAGADREQIEATASDSNDSSAATDESSTDAEHFAAGESDEPVMYAETVEKSTPATHPERVTSSKLSSADTAGAELTDSSRLKFVLLASYASAITLVALMLLLRSGESAKPHHLESLPDVAPEPAENLSYVPVKATLPPGHTLSIGEKQRFGNIEVEVLGIRRQPLEFTHYTGSENLTRPASAPVLKLWLRFTNVSKNQEIAPLDGDLLFRWVVKTDLQQEFSNYYLFADGTTNDRDVISTYRHSKTSDWDFKGQQLGQVLAPGESLETFIASSEELPATLPDQLNWRLQIRKGFSPNGHGVTTLVDVRFAQEQIEEPAASSNS